MCIMCIPGAQRIQRKASNSWNWSYRQSWVAMWMLGIEPFGRTDIGFNCWIHSPVHDKDIWMWGFLSQFSKFLSCFSFFYLLGDFISCLWSCSVFPPFLSVSPSLLYVMHRSRALCMLAKYSISEQHLLISAIFSNNFFLFCFNISKFLTLLLTVPLFCCLSN